MEFTFNGILGFLSGSLATLVIKGLLDWLNKKHEFKRELVRLMYIRKLDTGEKIVSHMISYLQRLVTAKVLIQELQESLKNLDFRNSAKLDELFKKYGTEIEELDKLTNDNRNAAYLYFDFDFQKGAWSEEVTRIGYKHMFSIQIASQRIAELGNLSQSETDETIKQTRKDEVIKLVAELIVSFGLINKLVDATTAEMIKNIQEVKNKLK